MGIYYPSCWWLLLVVSIILLLFYYNIFYHNTSKGEGVITPLLSPLDPPLIISGKKQRQISKAKARFRVLLWRFNFCNGKFQWFKSENVFTQTIGDLNTFQNRNIKFISCFSPKFSKYISLLTRGVLNFQFHYESYSYTNLEWSHIRYVVIIKRILRQNRNFNYFKSVFSLWKTITLFYYIYLDFNDNNFGCFLFCLYLNTFLFIICYFRLTLVYFIIAQHRLL